MLSTFGRPLPTASVGRAAPVSPFGDTLSLSDVFLPSFVMLGEMGVRKTTRDPGRTFLGLYRIGCFAEGLKRERRLGLAGFVRWGFGIIGVNRFALSWFAATWVNDILGTSEGIIIAGSSKIWTSIGPLAAAGRST